MFPRLHRFGAVRIAFQDLAPGGAVVGKLLCRLIEPECDAFAVVAIEAVVIQIVTEFRRADLRQFVPGKMASRVPRKQLLDLLLALPRPGESQNLRFVFNRSVHFCIRGDQWLIQPTAWPPPRVLRRSLALPVVLLVDSTRPRFQP